MSKLSLKNRRNSAPSGNNQVVLTNADHSEGSLPQDMNLKTDQVASRESNDIGDDHCENGEMSKESPANDGNESVAGEADYDSSDGLRSFIIDEGEVVDQKKYKNYGFVINFIAADKWNAKRNLESWKDLAIEEAPIFYEHLTKSINENANNAIQTNNENSERYEHCIILLTSTEVSEKFVEEMLAPKKGYIDEEAESKNGTPHAILTFLGDREKKKCKETKEGYIFPTENITPRAKYGIATESGVEIVPLLEFKNRHQSEVRNLPLEEFIEYLKEENSFEQFHTYGQIVYDELDRYLQNYLKNVNINEFNENGYMKAGKSLSDAKANNVAFNLVRLRYRGEDLNVSTLRMARPDLTKEDIEEGKSRAREWIQVAVRAVIRLRARNHVWRHWQLKLMSLIMIPPRKIRGIDRQCVYIKDRVGKSGKSFLMSKICDLFPEMATQLPNAKAENMTYLLSKVQSTIQVLFINKARSEKYLDCSVIECIKDGTVFSTKYDCKMLKFLETHVVIFGNTEPNFEDLSQDRWVVFDIMKSCNNHYEIYQRRNITDPVLPDLSNALSSTIFDKAKQYWESLNDFSYSYIQTSNGTQAQEQNKEQTTQSINYASLRLYNRPQIASSSTQDFASLSVKRFKRSKEPQMYLLGLPNNSSNVPFSKKSKTDEVELRCEEMDAPICDDSKKTAFEPHQPITNEHEREQFNRIVDNYENLNGKPISASVIKTIAEENSWVKKQIDSMKTRGCKNAIESLRKMRERFVKR